MRALRKGLTAGLKESVEWASAAAGDFRRGSSSGAGGSSHGGGGEDESSFWGDDDDGDGDDEEHLVIEVVSATGLGARACFAALCLSDASGALRGRRACTTVRAHTAEPVWHSCRDLGVTPAPGDVLLLELYAPDWSRCVGAAHVSAADLPEGGPARSLPLRRLLDPRSCGGQAAQGGSGVVTLRRLVWSAAGHSEKTLFLVRHGQSRWNEAQKNRRLDVMAAFDHPLTRAGAHQAAALRDRWTAAASAPAADAPPPLPPRAPPVADLLGLDLGAAAPPPPPKPAFSAAAANPWADEVAVPEVTSEDAELGAPDAAAAAGDAAWLAAFQAASFVASSPLTRALQTCLVALRGHPGLAAHGVTLLRAAREIKGVGGLDSVGKAVGDEILARATSALAEELPDEPAVVSAAAATRVVVNDAGAEWWTAADDVDAADDVMERCADLASSIQFAPGESAILVGHSLLFRDFIRRYGGTKLAAAAPALAAKLADGKLQNGGCIGLRLQFSRGRVRIVDARLMFGSAIVARYDH